jgi:integrase
MSTDAISPLRRRMIEDMDARKLCAGTQRGHIHSCKRFAAFLNRSPDTATAEDIRRFQLHLSETGASICNRNRIMTGLRILFRVTLRRLDLAAEIYHIREPQKIPLVMSPDETKRLLAVASSLKARILLSLGYGCGLRAGEVVRLKVKHIDSAQKIIRVEQSKGRKDRNVMLSAETLDLLRQWWKARPSRCDAGTPVAERWLFQEGCDPACAAPQLRHPPARTRHRYQNHPGAAGSRQIRHYGALHACRHRHNRRHREPARPAVAAAQETQKEQERAPDGVIARSHVSSSAGGRGYFPRPRPRLALRQRRARQPRPDEGDDSDRALPHRGARRPCRAL